MTTALPRFDLSDATLTGCTALTLLLSSLGITTTYTPLPWQDAAILDPDTHVLRLNAAASPAEHVHAMGAIWRLLVLGEHASPAAPVPPVRALHAVS